MFFYVPVMFLVGVALEINAARTIAAGDPLIGTGQLLLGIAAVIASAASLVTVLMNNRKIDNAQVGITATKNKAVEAATNSATAVASIDEHSALLDGIQSILDEIRAVVGEIKNFETYQHTRNHDLLGILSELKGSTLLLIEIAERLLAKLKENP